MVLEFEDFFFSGERWQMSFHSELSKNKQIPYCSSYGDLLTLLLNQKILVLMVIYWPQKFTNSKNFNMNAKIKGHKILVLGINLYYIFALNQKIIKKHT